jgi:hypothetical protein
MADKDLTTIQWDQQIQAERYILDANKDKQIYTGRSHSNSDWDAVIIYQAKDKKNLLEKSNIIQISDFEQRIQEMRSWQKVCLAQSSDNLSCHDEESFQSPLNYLSSYGNSVMQSELEVTS